MTHTQQEKFNLDLSIDIMARTLWGEARGQGAKGMRAVAHVILNRVKIARAKGGSWWGDNVINVCQKPFQFSTWNRDDPNYLKLMRVNDRNPEFRLARAVSRAVLIKNEFDVTSGATHYHRFDMMPYWARGKTPVKRIGDHVFYAMPEEA